MRLVASVVAAIVLASCSTPRGVDDAVRDYDRRLAAKAAPLLEEAIRFPTVEGNVPARDGQKAWLVETARGLGLVARDAGKVVEVELPGPSGGPVLGLVVHGDVQPADAKAWSVPPFDGVAKDEEVWGRGAADDKGPLVQALLAMKALEQAGPPRTHTIRLLVGSDEESASTDMKEYLAAHAPPDYSLVLDYLFPVVVGEKAWTGLYVTASPGPRSNAELPFRIEKLEAGLAPSIVPDRAELTLRWIRGTPMWGSLIERLNARPLQQGTTLEATEPFGDPGRLAVVVQGKSVHGGLNLERGRNALVALARAAEGLLPASGENDLLTFARVAGQDFDGTGLGLSATDKVWGGYQVNVATIAPEKDGRLTLKIVLRRPPPLTGPQIREHLERFVARFNARTGSSLTTDGYWTDEPLSIDPEAKLVKRLLAAYARATGKAAAPAIAGGATYAQRLPNSVAFGMWFPDRPYPGHEADEKIAIADLHRGTRVLIEALSDVACGPKIDAPLTR